MANSELSQSGPGDECGGFPHSPPSGATGRASGPPGYDTGKEGYAGISAGVLDDPDDVRAARDFAEMIVDTVREGLLVLDFDLRVKAANESFYDTFGVEPEETVGRRVYDIGSGQWDIPELRDLVEGILRERSVFNDYEIEREFEGVGRRVMLLNARRLDDHRLILLALEDVTARRAGEAERARAEADLRESEERFRLLVENAKEYAIFAMDEEGAVTMWSPGAERILGWSGEEALGMPGAVIFTPEEREAGVPEREMARAREGGSALDERWHVRKDGSRFWATGTMVALQSGSLRGYAKILRDNTRRKEAEDVLRALNETLEERVEERTRQVRALSRSLSLAEQEERRRIAYLLHDDLQQVLVAAKMATGDAGKVHTLLDEAIALTRSLSHELSPPLLKGEDLGDLLYWLAEQKRELYGLDVRVEVVGEALMLEADLRILVYQIVRELLFNVAKHAGTHRVRVEAEQTDHHVRVVVEDAGAGFDPATLEESGNAGLGLPSVRERLGLVGGRLDVASKPGEGTRVTVEVPLGPE